MEYRVIRSKRRSLAIEVTRDGEVLVRVPYLTLNSTIKELVESHEKWILKTVEHQKQKAQNRQELSSAQIAELKLIAAEYLPKRVEAYSKITGLCPTAIKITSAKTRFGSCSGKNSICFSCRLMQYPPEAIDYVVLHELAHIRHHNHSKNFFFALNLG